MYALILCGFIVESLVMLFHGYSGYEFADRNLQLNPVLTMIVACAWGIGISLVVIIAMYSLMMFGSFEEKMAGSSNKEMVENRYQIGSVNKFIIPFLIVIFLVEVFTIYSAFRTGTFRNPNAFNGGMMGFALFMGVIHYVCTGTLVFLYYQWTGKKAMENVDRNLGMGDSNR